MIELEWSTLAVFGFVLAVTVWLQTLWSERHLPPGPSPAWPLIGHLPYMALNAPKMGGLHKLSEHMSKTLGPVVRLRIGPSQNMVFVTDYKLLKQAFVKKSDVFSDRPGKTFALAYKIREGKGLLLQSGSRWQELRRLTLLVLRDFGMGKMDQETLIHTEAQYILDDFLKQGGREFDPNNTLTNAVSNIICCLTFGKRYDYGDEEFTELLHSIQGFFRTLTLYSPYNFLPFLLHLPLHKSIKDIMAYMAKIKKYTHKAIEEHRSSLDMDNPRDIIDVFLKAQTDKSVNPEITDEGNMNNVILDLFSAGTDTTSASIMWLLLYLMEYPEVQQKCQQQLDEAVGRGRMVSMKDRVDLPYVEATIFEIQRISSIATMTVPHFTAKDTTLGIYNIGKGTIVFGNLWAINMNEQNWPNPKRFNPDRWIGPDGKVHKPEHFIPFSMGPRMCLGEILARAELFLFSSVLMQNFTFEKTGPVNLNGLQGILNTPRPFTMRAVPR